MKRTPIKRIGARGRRNLTADRKWSRAVLTRDKYRCRRCGRPAECAHHILGKQANPELRHNLDNGVALCDLCHAWSHANPTAQRKLFGE